MLIDKDLRLSISGCFWLFYASKYIIEKGQKHLVEDFENHILFDIKKLVETLSKEDEQFFRCLSYLISINRIEFVATVSTKGGLGHDKYGIFKDERVIKSPLLVLLIFHNQH